jgi:hypothetical protein
MREEGYYFIKLYGEWLIGSLFIDEQEDDKPYWFMCGNSYMYPEKDFDEIGAKIELPKD